jgi:hypothetical protein
MNDQWVPSPPSPPPTWTPNPLPPSNVWNDTEACSAPSGPSIVDGIVITGVPATVSSLYWQVNLNDGSSPPNFQINHLDGKGAVLDAALQISGVDLSATFAGPVYLARDPVEPMEAVTLEYLEAHGAGVPEVPDNQTYGRTEGAWNLVVPAAGGTFTGPTNLSAGGAVTSGALLFAGNAVCSVPTVAQLQIGDGSAGQVPTADGNGNLTWTTPTTGGPYLPLSGGTVTGSLTVNQVLTVQGSNSLVLNAPNGQQRAILGQTSTLTRWQLMLGDGTSEGLNNTGSNFSLTAYATAGGFLGNWLTIARADGSTTFNGSGVTIAGGLAVNGLLAVNSVGNLYVPGGSPGQVLSTNGSGILSWANQSGGIPDAPSNGTQYGRQSGAWTPISVSGGPPVTISDTAPSGVVSGDLWWDSVGGQLYVYFTDANSSQWVAAVNFSGGASAAPSNTAPLINGTAAAGTSVAWSRGDHVHPTDTSRAPLASPALTGVPTAPTAAASTSTTQLATTAFVHAQPVAMNDNRIINGDMRIDQRNGGVGGTAVGYTVDRWMYVASQTGKGNWGQGAPAVGFGAYLGFTSTSAYASVAADYFEFFQPIEADMVSDFQWGTVNAQPVTLSFWASASLTGIYSGTIQNYAGTRTYPFSYSIPTANTWVKIVIPIPGDTGGAWVMTGNAGSMYVAFDLGSGSSRRGPAGAWASASYIGVTGSVSVVGTNGAGFTVTGVKLEIGSVATPYNRQSLAKSLADCQRYYQVVGPLYSFGYNTTSVNFMCSYAVQTMRAAPTITLAGTSYSNCSGANSQNITTNSFNVYATVTATGSAYFNASCLLSAEL